MMVQPLVLLCWGLQVGSIALYTYKYLNIWRDEIHSFVAQWQMKHGNAEDEKVRRGQERQCIYNVTLRRIRATIVAVGKENLLHILRVCL